MYTTYFVIANIAIVILLAIQLIRLNTYVMKCRKDIELSQTEIKEDTNWQFVKGLY